MASYRYERDIAPADLAPRAEKQYTRKERWANWWDYNLKWVLLIGIAAAFVAYSFIGQYFFTTKPDYNVAVVAPYYLPDDTVTALQEQLARYGEDLNGDGKTVVTLNVYTLDYSAGDTQTESDAYLTMAGTTKLATDVAGGLSSVFLLYDPAGFQESTGSLRYLDGTLPEAGSDSDWWNMVYRWTDCPVLAGLDLGEYRADTTHAQGGDSLTYLADFYIGMRGEPCGRRGALAGTDRRGGLHRGSGGVSRCGSVSCTGKKARPAARPPRRNRLPRPLRPVPLSWKTPMGDTMERRGAGKI